MPVAVRPPSGNPAPPAPTGLRTPQARVLAALMPTDTTDHPDDWPLLTRSQLGLKAGYTAISGTITRALNGIKAGSTSGDPHPGLIDRNLISTTKIQVEDGCPPEINYKITLEGVREYERHMATKGKELPKVKDASICTNDRYVGAK